MLRGPRKQKGAKGAKGAKGSKKAKGLTKCRGWVVRGSGGPAGPLGAR